MSNEFYVSNAVIPNENALESLIAPSAKNSTVITVDYDSTQTIGFGDLYDSHVIAIVNSSTAGNPNVALPDNEDLILMFKSPQQYSVLTWIFEVVGLPITLTWDDSSTGTVLQVGVYTVLVQITNLTPTFDIKISQFGSSSVNVTTMLSETISNGGNVNITGVSLGNNYVTGSYGPIGYTILPSTTSPPVGGETITIPVGTTTTACRNFMDGFYGGYARCTIATPVTFYLNNATNVNLTLAVGDPSLTLPGTTNIMANRTYLLTLYFNDVSTPSGIVGVSPLIT